MGAEVKTNDKEKGVVWNDESQSTKNQKKRWQATMDAIVKDTRAITIKEEENNSSRITNENKSVVEITDTLLKRETGDRWTPYLRNLHSQLQKISRLKLKLKEEIKSLSMGEKDSLDSALSKANNYLEQIVILAIALQQSTTYFKDHIKLSDSRNYNAIPQNIKKLKQSFAEPLVKKHLKYVENVACKLSESAPQVHVDRSQHSLGRFIAQSLEKTYNQKRSWLQKKRQSPRRKQQVEFLNYVAKHHLYNINLLIGAALIVSNEITFYSPNQGNKSSLTLFGGVGSGSVLKSILAPLITENKEPNQPDIDYIEQLERALKSAPNNYKEMVTAYKQRASVEESNIPNAG